MADENNSWTKEPYSYGTNPETDKNYLQDMTLDNPDASEAQEADAPSVDNMDESENGAAQEAKAVPATDVDQQPTTVEKHPDGLTDEQKAQAVAGYDEYIFPELEAALARTAPETEEDRKKRERKEKSKKIVAAITDGLSALSNLYFTSQYAPNMYNHEKQSTLTPLEAKFEKAKAEREKNADKHFNIALQMGNALNQKAATLREMQAQAEKLQQAREKHGWLRNLQADKEREQKGKADKAVFDADRSREMSEWEPKQQEATYNKTMAQTKAAEASANASNASAYKSRTEADAVREFPAWDENGNEHKFKTKEASIAFAIQHGTYYERDEVETSEKSTTNSRGKTSKSKSTKTKKKGYAGKPSPTGGKKSPTA